MTKRTVTCFARRVNVPGTKELSGATSISTGLLPGRSNSRRNLRTRLYGPGIISNPVMSSLWVCHWDVCGGALGKLDDEAQLPDAEVAVTVHQIMRIAVRTAELRWRQYSGPGSLQKGAISSRLTTWV